MNTTNDFRSLLDVPSVAYLKDELRQRIDEKIRILQDILQHTGINGGSGSLERDLTLLKETTDQNIGTILEIADGVDRIYFPPAFGPREVGYQILCSLPGIELVHLYRICAHHWNPDEPIRDARAIQEDPRSLQEIRDSLDYPKAPYFAFWVWNTFEAERVLPWALADTQRIISALSRSDTAPSALRALRVAPSLPDEVCSSVLAIALGKETPYRTLARQVLGTFSSSIDIALEALGSRSVRDRIGAAHWLSELADPAAVPEIRKRLDKEKSLSIRAALFEALAACGDDFSDLMSPEALAAQAAKAAKVAVPDAVSWLDFSTLPTVHWKDGVKVDPTILRWWIITAVKAKEPSGRGLFEFYLDCLDPHDAAALSSFLFHAWIAEDTRYPTRAESKEWALREGTQVYHKAQANGHIYESWAYPLRSGDYRGDNRGITLDEWVAAAFSYHSRFFIGHALDSKGLLALTVRMDGAELAQAFEEFEVKGARSQGQHRFQLLALLSVLAARGSQECVAVLQRIAIRHKMRTVQEKALALIEDIARRRGWSADELADRTILSGGFNEDGQLLLSYGPREFTAHVTTDLKIELRDSSGAVIKKLPEPHSADNSVEASEAKKALARARREVKSVTAMQSARLHEAMCSQRMWPVSDWLAFLAAHPIMGRLLPRLVWICHPQGGSRKGTSGSFLFRPVGDGTYINDEGGAVTLPEDCEISVAHSALITAAESEKWCLHLKKERVKPLFDQFSATTPPFPLIVSSYKEKAGYVTTTFALRNVAKKRGYSRGEVLDAGWFYDYVKPFRSLGYEAVVTFSGSYLPEEDRECAVIAFEIRKHGKPIQLDSAPPVLVAECYMDYCAMADTGTYDSQWESRVP